MASLIEERIHEALSKSDKLKLAFFVSSGKTTTEDNKKPYYYKKAFQETVLETCPTSNFLGLLPKRQDMVKIILVVDEQNFAECCLSTKALVGEGLLGELDGSSCE